MSSKSGRIFNRFLQLLTLLVVFVAGGIILPAFIAPTVFDVLPITTREEARQQQLSLRTENRNANYGESFAIEASSPAGDVSITNVSYSCSFSDVTLAYESNGSLRELPCDQTVQLPAGQARHEITALSQRNSPAYVPLTYTISASGSESTLSSVVVLARNGANEKSRLSDTTEVTLAGE